MKSTTTTTTPSQAAVPSSHSSTTASRATTSIAASFTHNGRATVTAAVTPTTNENEIDSHDTDGWPADESIPRPKNFDSFTIKNLRELMGLSGNEHAVEWTEVRVRHLPLSFLYLIGDKIYAKASVRKCLGYGQFDEERTLFKQKLRKLSKIYDAVGSPSYLLTHILSHIVANYSLQTAEAVPRLKQLENSWASELLIKRYFNAHRSYKKIANKPDTYRHDHNQFFREKNALRREDANQGPGHDSSPSRTASREASPSAQTPVHTPSPAPPSPAPLNLAATTVPHIPRIDALRPIAASPRHSTPGPSQQAHANTPRSSVPPRLVADAGSVGMAAGPLMLARQVQPTPRRKAATQRRGIPEVEGEMAAAGIANGSIPDTAVEWGSRSQKYSMSLVRLYLVCRVCGTSKVGNFP